MAFLNICPTYLHLNIQNTRPPLIRHILDRLHTRPVEVAPELSMLNETSLVHQLQELLLGGIVVVDAIFLSFPGGTGRVRYREAKAAWVGLEKSLEQSGFASAGWA